MYFVAFSIRIHKWEEAWPHGKSNWKYYFLCFISSLRWRPLIHTVAHGLGGPQDSWKPQQPFRLEAHSLPLLFPFCHHSTVCAFLEIQVQGKGCLCGLTQDVWEIMSVFGCPGPNQMKWKDLNGEAWKLYSNLNFQCGIFVHKPSQKFLCNTAGRGSLTGKWSSHVIALRKKKKECLCVLCVAL